MPNSLLNSLYTKQGSIKRYLLTTPPNGQMWHKVFFKVVQAQGQSPDASGIPKNASGPIGIPLKRGASGARQ